MYKIMIHIDTHTNDTWFYYQEEGKDYVANSLEEIRETVLTLIDVYGEDYIKIVKQETGDDMSGSVETFLYDSTDNYEELVNRPFINGVEIIGELSLAELGIQPEGNYATNERVDALEETVNNIDFSPYATNERVEQVEAKVDAIDLEPYATMDYLDEVVAGIDFSASNENITGVKTFSVLPRSTVVPVAEDELTNKAYVDHEVFGCATEEYVDEAIENIKIPVFEVAALGAVQYDAYMTEAEGKRFLEYCNEHYNEFIQVYLYCPTSSLSGIYSGTPVANDWGNGIFKLYSNATGYKSGIIYGTYLYVNADMTEDGRFDTTQGCRPYIHCDSMLNVSANYLSRTNTREYTPTTAYHPATKKYVDDAVAANAGPSMNIFEFTSPLDLGTLASYNNPQVYIWDDIAEQFGQAMLKASNTDGKLIIIVNFPDFETNGYLQSTNICQERFVFLQKQDQIIVDDTLRYYTFGSQVVSNTYDPLKDLPEASPLKIYCGIQLNDDGTVKLLDYHFTLSYHPNKFLSTNNYRAFTPTSDYHPATKKYVDDAVANIDVPDVDLTNYYTKEEINGLITSPTGRHIYNVEFNMSGGSDILGPNTLNQIGEMITNWYKTSERSMLMFASFQAGNNDGIRYSYIYQGLYTWNTGTYYDKTTGLNYQNKVFQFNKLSDNAGKVFDSVSIRMEGSWDNDVYTCTKCAFTVGTDLAAEIKTIKQDYAKTADVTTMINSAISGALEGGY